MKVLLIRHGATAGNLEGRYIGRTDEPLTEKAEAALLAAAEDFRATAGERFKVYISPAARCRQTAGLLFPGVQPTVVSDLRECDFGRFENKNYRVLNGDHDYQRFLDSGGTEGFPQGERIADFRARCAGCFARIIRTEAAARTYGEKACGKAGHSKINEGEAGHSKVNGSEADSGKANRCEKGTGEAGNGEICGREPEGGTLVFVVHGGTIMSVLSEFARPARGYFEWRIGNGEGYLADVSLSGETPVLTGVRKIAASGRV